MQRLQDAGGLMLDQLGLAGILLALIGRFLFQADAVEFLDAVERGGVQPVCSDLRVSGFLFVPDPGDFSAAVWVGLGLGGLLQPTLAYFKGFKPAAAMFGLLLGLAAWSAGPRWMLPGHPGGAIWGRSDGERAAQCDGSGGR